ncbi:MAG: type II toxin-antitoxin system death-on-curing family toxin [Synechococcales bacterium]|nr:type II toxin-antitoxin system death-on-curing family toxin [Synechococcales bacterium]
MIHHLTNAEVMAIHHRILQQSGGTQGLRDLGTLKSALAQPMMTFGGEDCYPTVIDKAAALGFSLVMNHPFVDGNKLTGHAAIEIFLVMNGWEIVASVDDQEAIMVSLAAGSIQREGFTQWLKARVCPL